MDSALQHAIERMDHFPTEELFAHREPAFAALQAWAAEAAGESLLFQLAPLAELRFDVGRQVVGLVSHEALFFGTLVAASLTRKRGKALPARIPVAFERLRDLEREAGERVRTAQGRYSVLEPLLRFAADRLTGAACRADSRLTSESTVLGSATRHHVAWGVAVELELGIVHGGT